MKFVQARFFLKAAGLITFMLLPQACVGKFLSTMLTNEGANFKLIEATPVANTRIRVSFNKPLDKVNNSGTVLSNYSIPGLNLVSVEAGSETHQVFLNLNPADSVRMERIQYTLTVSNVLNQTLDPLLSDGRSLTFMGTRYLRAICQNDDGTNSCPPLSASGGAGTGYSIKIRGDYAVGTNYRWRLLNTAGLTPINSCANPHHTNHPTCNDNGMPALDNGIPGNGTVALDWSTATPVSTPIRISGLVSGNYRLELAVQDALGAWQPAGSETKFDFFVDATPPENVGLGGASGPSAIPAYTATTNVSITNVSVRPRSCTEFPLPAPNCSASPEGPSHYQYRVYYQAGACPVTSPALIVNWQGAANAISTNIPINLNMTELNGDGCYAIQVVARDIAGNWQCDTSKADGDNTACGSPSSGSITNFFNTKPWQVAHFHLDTAHPTASFISGTTPNDPTASTSLTVGVTASADVPYYRYRITGPGQAGIWSNDKVSGPGGTPNAFISGTPPGEFISASGLSNGETYTIDIIGKDPAGNYQPTSTPTSYSFTVNTSVPTAVLTAYTGAGGCVGQQGLPNNPTNNNCFSVVVGGPGVTHYKATFVSGTACPNNDAAYEPAAAVSANYINTSPGFVHGQTYSICVRGGAAGTGPFGLAAGEITKHTFTFDSQAPTGTAVTQLLTPAYATAPASGTIRTVLKDADVIIGQTSGEAVLAYKGAIYETADCAVTPGLAAIQALTEKSVYTPIQRTGMNNAEHRVCFIGRDAAGNYQSSVQQYAFTVFDPPAPADGGGALDNASVPSFDFSWSAIPGGVTEIRIRICTDAACVSPIPGFQNGVVVCGSAGACAGATQYTLVSNCTGLGCIKALNGSGYYAQLRVTDAAGNLSSFGPASNGKVITGGITGVIRDTNGNPVSGATVTLRQSGCGAAIGANVITTGTGVFTFNSGSGHNVPISLASVGYCVQATTTGPNRQGEKRFINVEPATNTNAGDIYVVDTTGAGCIIGSLVDGSTGSQLALSNATFTLKDWNGNTISGAPSLDPDGKQFVFPATCVASTAAWGNSPYTSPLYNYGCLNPKNTNVPTCNNNARPALDNAQADGAASTALSSGVYSVQAAVPNYYSFTEPSIGVTNAATTHTGYLPMVGTFTAGSKEIKVILTWGTGAKDLDLHVVGPSNTGTDCQTYNEATIQNATASKFHVYFQQKFCANGSTTGPYGSTSLAVDDTFEYGPEIINFYDGYVDAGPAIYKFSVFNNDTVAPNWTTSKARVYVYAGNFFTSGGGLIKKIDVHTSSTNRLWRPFRMSISGTTLTVDDNGGSTFGYVAATYAQMVGTSDGLTAGAAPAAGTNPADPNTDPGLFANGTTVAGGAGLADW